MRWILILSMLFSMTISGCGLVKDANHTRITIRQLEKDEKIGVAQAQRDAEIGKAKEQRIAQQSKWNNISGIFSSGFFWAAVIAGMILFYKMFRFVIPVTMEFYEKNKMIPQKYESGIIVENHNYYIVNVDGRKKQIDQITAKNILQTRGGK